MATINTNIENNSIDNKSFAILRTNPKLTTNVKLVVNSIGDLFLSSFRASKELSKVEYQKFELKSTGKYSYDVASFYKGLPSIEKYKILRKFSDTTVYSDYQFQHEDQYHYGAIHNETKLYDEQYKIFAPIWLERKIPSKFVIYRVEDVEYKKQYSENTIGQNGRILEILKNATIVKTFDLSNSSKLGEYISNHVNDRQFPNSAISVNFKEGSQSFFNGIDTVNGGFSSKAEQFDKYYTQVDYPEFFSNEIITGGFERNGLAVANIINLEFLFDDNNASDYKIYRYFGLYVDDMVEGSFVSEGAESDGSIKMVQNTYQTNYDLTGTGLVDIDMMPIPSDFNLPTLRFIKDIEGTFYNLKGSVVSQYNKFLINSVGEIDQLFKGYGRTGKTITSLSKKPNPRGFIKFTVKATPSTNDRLFIGDKTEIGISDYNLGDYLIIADSSIPAARAVDNKFSTQGSLEQIAIAISQAIKNGEVITYQTRVEGNSVIIEDLLAGNRRRQSVFGIYNQNLVDFIQIDSAEPNNIGLVNSLVPSGITTNFLNWDMYTMIGGSNEGQSILVKSSEIGNVKVGEWVKLKDNNKFIQIIEIEKDPFEIDLYRIILDSKVILSNDNVFEIYDVYRTQHGLFSAYDFKDFDFDFYSERNSNLGDLVYDESTHGFISSTFYSGLTGVLENEKIEDTIVSNGIKNEYDRLNENKLKETALNSRIVPTICKFNLKDASNARNLPYILNVSEAFGEDNLSPNIEIDSPRKVEYMNMEHFHINRIPKTLHGNGRNDFNNYIDFAGNGGITIDKLKDISFDYFNSYFNWNGYYDTVDDIWYDNTSKRLWSKFDNGNDSKNSSTVFRGLRYSYLKRKENLNEVPTEFISDSSVNDYKFGVVFSYYMDVDSTGNTIVNNSINVSVVKNDVFKFICIVITMNVVENDVNEIDRYLMYTLKDVTLQQMVLNTDIPFFIDFQSQNSSFSGINDQAVLYASLPSIIDGSAKFTKYVRPNEFGEFSWIYFNIGVDTWAVKVVGILNDESILVSGWPYLFDINTGQEVPGGLRLDPSQFSLIPSTSYIFKYFEGGKNEFANLLNEINAYNFANRFNKFGEINYINIDKNGLETLNDYVLSIESGVDIIKPSLIKSETDPDRPKAYQLSSGEIGSIIVDREDGGYITLLRRMNGDYNPLFNDVINFTDTYSRNKIISNTWSNLQGTPSAREIITYNKLNGTGIAFESFKNNRSDYGYINNYFYHKVNDEDSKNILKLSQTSDKLPLYPVIGEIAIDKKNVNLFKSKYASDYFIKSLPAGDFRVAHGTLSPVEKKNFMVSTIMKVKDSYDITKFTNVQEKTLESLDKIRINNTNIETIHWFEDEYQVIADFYLPDAVLGELIEDGIKTSFKKYVNPINSFGDKSSIDDDLKLYANANISTRFIIDNVDIYGIEGKDLSTDFVSVLNTKELLDGGFTKMTNFNIQSYQNDGLSFRLIYNKRRGYTYNFKVHVKIQA